MNLRRGKFNLALQMDYRQALQWRLQNVCAGPQGQAVGEGRGGGRLATAHCLQGTSTGLSPDPDCEHFQGS